MRTVICRSVPTCAILLLAPLPCQTTQPALATAASAWQRSVARAEKLRARGDEDAAVALVRRVLDEVPDHPAARTFLGFHFHEGRWRLPAEIAYLEQARRRGNDGPASAVTVEDRSDRAVAALRRALRFAEQRAMALRSSGAVGFLSVSLQHTRLLGLDAVPVGFVNGGGRLQLPRTESIGLGSTVALPLGR